MTVRYECQDVYSHEVIEFIDAAADYPDWWAVPPITIVEVTDDEV